MSDIVRFSVGRADPIKPPTLRDIVHAHYGDDQHQTTLRARIAVLDDDAVIDLYATNENAAEEAAAPHIFARHVLQDDVRRRFAERRAKRGPEDTAPIEMPHPRIEVRSEFKFGAYRVDASAVEHLLRKHNQPNDVVAKVLSIEEPRDETVLPLSSTQKHAIADAAAEVRGKLPAVAAVLDGLLETRRTQRTVAIRNMTSYLAFVRKIAGSPLGDALEALIDRPNEGERVIFKPRARAAAPRNVTPEANAS